MAKINQEDPKTTQKYMGEDASQSTFTTPTSDLDSDSDSEQSLNESHTNNGKRNTKPKGKSTHAQYAKKFDIEYANALFSYHEQKKNRKKRDPIGTIRDLLPFEEAYFTYMENHYRDIPTIRKNEHDYNRPPRTWLLRFGKFRRPNTEAFESDIQLLLHFATTCCPSAQRNNWLEVLSPFKIGTTERFLWALLFLKSTNGVADKVSCGHFRLVVKNHPPISMDLYKEPLKIASILRQTSKWVKNTVVLVNILRHIQVDLKGEIPMRFSDWLNYYEIGPKTASLLFHAAFGQQHTVPIDSHVWYAFNKLKWTNAKYREECSWQASQWISPKYFITTNDAIGSIRQTLANRVTKQKALRLVRDTNNPRLSELVDLLV